MHLPAQSRTKVAHASTQAAPLLAVRRGNCKAHTITSAAQLTTNLWITHWITPE